MASGIQEQGARQRSENISYVVEILENHPDDTLAEAVAKMLRNGTLQRAASASERTEFSPWGKELSLSVKRYKHLPAGLCHSILGKIEPSIYGEQDVFDDPPLNCISFLRRRLQFALAVSEDDTLPMNYLSYRFEKGFLEYCLRRYTMAGKRLAKIKAADDVAYYKLEGAKVTVLAPMREARAKKDIVLLGLEGADDWQIENNISCRAEVVSKTLGERKVLAKKFIDQNAGTACFHDEGGDMNIDDEGIPAWCRATELPKGVRSMFWKAKEQAEAARAKAKAKAKAKHCGKETVKKRSKKVT